MDKKKRRIGDTVTTVHRWEWQQCEYCHLPAKYRVTFLLPNCRTNPASSAYHHDDCTWCSDAEVYVCEKHKRARLAGYEPCSTFPLARYRKWGWFKARVE